MTDSSAIAAQLTPVVATLGLSLYDVEVNGSGRLTVVRVLIDREGGVDLDAITEATNAITPLLDQAPLADSMPGSFTLEVSSPGLERPLRRPDHFRAAIGSIVSVKLRADGEPARRIRGVLTAADDESVDVDVDHETVRVPLDAVVQARTVFEWGPTPKPGKRTRGQQQAAKEVARR